MPSLISPSFSLSLFLPSRACVIYAAAAGHSIEDEEDTEDRSDNLVVVAFDESNGSIDESTSETHLNESGKKRTASNRNVGKLQGHRNEMSCKLQDVTGGEGDEVYEEDAEDEEEEEEEEDQAEGGGAVVSNTRTVANCIEANKRSFLVSGASSKSENTTTVESVAESKLRTRERLLAALTSLNGVTGVTRSSGGKYQQHQLKGSVIASNNHSSSSSGNNVSGGNSCLSPQPLSPSASDIGMKDEEEDEEDDDEGEGLLAMHTKEANGDFDPERLKAFNVIQFFVHSLFIIRCSELTSVTLLLTWPVFYFILFSLSLSLSLSHATVTVHRTIECTTMSTDVRATIRG